MRPACMTTILFNLYSKEFNRAIFVAHLAEDDSKDKDSSVMDPPLSLDVHREGPVSQSVDGGSKSS